MQELLERCADFSQLIEGEPPSPHAAQDLQADLPFLNDLADKFLYGIFLENAMVGVLDAFRNHPQGGVWWIHLLLLEPDQRGRGIGMQALNTFTALAGEQGALMFRLGAVEENVRALKFWRRMGFELVEKSRPRLFGQKQHVVWTMRKDLRD